MDKEKALTIWLPVIADGVKELPECKESLEMAIEALENQTSVIAEIERLKAEIQHERSKHFGEGKYTYTAGLKVAIDIIDNHIKELKGENK